MKTPCTFLLILGCFFTISNQAQQETNQPVKKYELSFGFSKLSSVDCYDMSFDYLLNDKSSIGITFFYSPKNSYFFGDLSLNQHVGISFNYKYYFSKNKNQGFYVSPLLTYSHTTQHRYHFLTRGFTEQGKYNRKDLSLGFNIGYKYVTKKDFFFDANIGIQKNIYNTSDLNTQLKLKPFAPRFGFSIGKRF